MNRYEEKLEARRERLLARAEKHRAISEASYSRVRRIMDGIPLGQPILVGHHSERHHRADIKRIDNGMRKSIDEGDYAKDLERRAAGVGTAGISSDDPEAVVKLKEELEKAEKVHATMKSANAIIHRKPKNEWTPLKETELMALKLTQSQAMELFKPDFCGRIGFPDYAITNNGANIRRIKGRIEELSKHAEREDKETEYEGFKIVENTGINRVQIIFPGKPSAEVREVCKRNGFRWSPYEGAWQRHLNNGGIWAAKEVAERLIKAQIEKGTVKP